MSKKSIEFGTIEKKPYQFAEIEWRIDNDLSDLEPRCLCELYKSQSFNFANTTWRLGIQVYEGHYGEGCFSSYLITETPHDHRVEYNFFVKDANGKVHFSEKAQFYGDTWTSEINFKALEFLHEEKETELLHDNIQSIICTLKLDNKHSNQPVLLQDKSPKQLIRLEKLSENFRNLFGDKETTDTSLEVKDQVYRVHRSVLIARSTVFAATFKQEEQTGVITILDCDPGSFKKFLEYLYCGKIEDLSFRDALNLYYTSDKYEVLELKEFCVESLMQSLTLENLCDAAILADKYEEKELLSAVQEFFNKNACKILETSDWEDLTKIFYRLSNKILKEKMKLSLE